IEVKVAVSGGDAPTGMASRFAGIANSCPPPQGGTESLAAPLAAKLAAVEDSVCPHAERGESLELTVRDDGAGIAAGQPPGFGLRGLQERVQALGGEFTIETGTIETGNGRGTCVCIIIPLPPRPAGSAQPLDCASTSP